MPQPIKKEVVFGKGSFDLRKGGLHGMLQERAEEMTGSETEALPQPKEVQEITWVFDGATDEDWDQVYDKIIERDPYYGRYLWEWEMRGMSFYY